MPKQSLTKRTMVRIYNKTVARWQQLCYCVRTSAQIHNPGRIFAPSRARLRSQFTIWI